MRRLDLRRSPRPRFRPRILASRGARLLAPLWIGVAIFANEIALGVEKPAGEEKPMRPVNLARGKEASAAAAQSGHDPSHAVDGDRSTRWCAKDAGSGYWWQVDLGKPEDLTGVRIVWEFDGRRYRYRLEGSGDGVTWTTLADETRGSRRSQEQLLQVEAPKIRFVRVTVTEQEAGSWASLREVEVLGTELEPVPEGEPEVAPRAGEMSERAARLLSELGVPKDFAATVFAAPPDVNYPTAIACAPAGAVFVAVDGNGSLDRERGRGKIVRCVDEDADGHADGFTTFASVESPRGLVADGDSVWVLHPPDLSVYHDDDGDGVADRSEVLVEGIAFGLDERPADHTSNNIRLAIDGWIYCAIGDFGFRKAVGRDGRTLELRGGGVVRVRPDGTGLELYAHGTRNIYDVAVSPLLDVFTRDNTNDGGGWDVRLHHLVELAEHGYPTLFTNFGDEARQPLAVYGGGSGTGALWLDEPGFPDTFGRGLYTSDWGRSEIYYHPLVRDGASFLAEEREFLRIPRPTDLDVDANGDLYVASWRGGEYRWAGIDVGFILRLEPKGGTRPAPFDPKALDGGALLRLLTSDSQVRRLAAQREILRRGSDAGFPDGIDIVDLVTDERRSLEARVALLFTHALLRGAGAVPVLALAAQSEDLAEFALRAASEVNGGDLGPLSAAAMAGLESENPRVRRASAVALARRGFPEYTPLILPLTRDADATVAHVASRALARIGSVSFLLAAVDHAAERPELARSALIVLRTIHEENVIAGLEKALSNPALAEIRRDVLTALARLYHREAPWDGSSWGTRPDTRGPYYRPEKWEGSSEIGEVLLGALRDGDAETVRFLANELRRHRVALDGAAGILLSRASEDSTLRAAAVEILCASPGELDGSSREIVRASVGDASLDLDLRARAFERMYATGNLDGAECKAAIASLARLLEAEDRGGSVRRARDRFVDVQRRSARTDELAALLLASDDPRTMEIAGAILVGMADARRGPRSVRNSAREAIRSAFDDPSRAAVALRVIAEARAETFEDEVREALEDSDGEVRDAARRAANRIGLRLAGDGGDADRITIASRGRGAAKEDVGGMPGDAKLGAALFEKQGCGNCHTVRPDEPPKGPFLGGISDRYNRVELATSVLDPSAQVAQGFATQWFFLKDGTVREGFVTREGGDEIELRNANGEAATVEIASIVERGTREGSVMPEALVDTLTVEELASLLAYLESLRAK